MERTLLILKPNAVQRSLVGEIIARVERKGLKIAALKMVRIREELAAEHYQEHHGKGFYPELIRFITSGPTVVMIVEGDKAVEIMRQLCGPTDPGQAAPGTIRGDYGMGITQNIIHASDSLQSAEREMSLFFTAEEILDYNLAGEPWV